MTIYVSDLISAMRNAGVNHGQATIMLNNLNENDLERKIHNLRKRAEQEMAALKERLDREGFPGSLPPYLEEAYPSKAKRIKPNGGYAQTIDDQSF